MSGRIGVSGVYPASSIGRPGASSFPRVVGGGVVLGPGAGADTEAEAVAGDDTEGGDLLGDDLSQKLRWVGDKLNANRRSLALSLTPGTVSWASGPLAL